MLPLLLGFHDNANIKLISRNQNNNLRFVIITVPYFLMCFEKVNPYKYICFPSFPTVWFGSEADLKPRSAGKTDRNQDAH